MTQRNRFWLFALLASFLVAAPLASGSTQEPSAEGTWQTIDDQTGKPRSLVTIRRDGEAYAGTITRLLSDRAESNPLCTACPDELKNRPLLGLQIIQGMKRDGLAYDDGTILDPENGTVYTARMRLTPDGQTLTVRGFVGLPLFGRSQTWQRVP